MLNAKITGLTVVDRDLEKTGRRLLAYFNVDLGGIAIKGCHLVRTQNRGFAVYPPRIDGPAGEFRAVDITDSGLRHRLMEAAREVYKLLGGSDGEWEPRSMSATE